MLSGLGLGDQDMCSHRRIDLGVGRWLAMGTFRCLSCSDGTGAEQQQNRGLIRLPGAFRTGRVAASASVHTISMASEGTTGTLVIGKWHRVLRWAVDELADKLAPEQLRKLNIRAGEHLAAILTTAFLGTAPTATDVTGGVDLWFDLPEPRKSHAVDIIPAHLTSAAFEVKSLPGPYRKFNARIDRDQACGIDPAGRSLQSLVRAAKDVVHDALPQLQYAQDQLHRKAGGDGISKNAFLVIHPFDGMAAEPYSKDVLGPYLDPLQSVSDLDTVWVLWPPHHLTMWSRERQEWINLMFELMNPDERPGELPALQDAEQYFFTRTGHTGSSPYLFMISEEEAESS